MKFNFNGRLLPYRISSPPPAEPVDAIPFREAHPRIYKTGFTLAGAIVTALAFWLAFPGVTFFGRFILATMFNVTFHDPSPSRQVVEWIIGGVTLAAVSLFVYVTHNVGRSLQRYATRD
jgi:hypothetical protein